MSKQKAMNKQIVYNYLSQIRYKENNTLIPSKWSKTSVGKEMIFYNGKAHEDCINKNGKYILVNSRFVSTGGQTIKYCDEQRFPLHKGDIAMVMSDVPNGKALAKCFFIKENSQYTLNQRICCFRSKNALPKYLRYILNRNKYYLAFDNGVGQTNLRKDEILKCPLILPPLKEQKAIVSVLEVWDKAIEKTEQLIQAKEKQFKWLLKKLITDQQNNPNWKKVKLGDVCEIKKGTQLNKLDMLPRGKYPVLNGGISFSGYTDKWNTTKNTVTISEGGNSCGYVNWNTEKFWAGGHCYSLNKVKREKVDVMFLYYQLKKKEKKIMELRVGSGLPNIQKGDIKNFPVLLPSLSEQKRIAHILHTNQKEIELLKKTLEKYRIQKKGLMQKLLTGHWRLKV